MADVNFHWQPHFGPGAGYYFRILLSNSRSSNFTWSSSALQMIANHQTWDVTVGLIFTSKLMAFSGIWFTYLCVAWLVTSEAIILPHYAINVPDIAAINLLRCLWFAGARCYFTYVVVFLNGLLMI